MLSDYIECGLDGQSHNSQGKVHASRLLGARRAMIVGAGDEAERNGDAARRYPVHAKRAQRDEYRRADDCGRDVELSPQQDRWRAREYDADDAAGPVSDSAAAAPTQV